MRRIIICFLITILAVGIILPFLNSVNNNKAEAASSDTCNHSNVTYFTGYSGESTNIHEMTRLRSKRSDAPLLTFIVHGQSGSAAHWSNNPYTYAFDKDDSALPEMLRNKNTYTSVYWARMSRRYNNTDYDSTFSCDSYNHEKYGYHFYPYKENHFFLTKLDASGYNTDNSNPATQTFLSKFDITKGHSVIIFESSKPESYHREVYEELHTVIDKISYDVACMTGKIPRVNIISHSRGGITGMMYASGIIKGGKLDTVTYSRGADNKLTEDPREYGSNGIYDDHPYNVAGLYSMGTPYVGTKLGSLSIVEELLPDTVNTESGKNILDPDIQKEIHSAWNLAIAQNPDLRLNAIVGKTDLNFLKGFLIEECSNIIEFNKDIEKLAFKIRIACSVILEIISPWVEAVNKIQIAINAAEGVGALLLCNLPIGKMVNFVFKIVTGEEILNEFDIVKKYVTNIVNNYNTIYFLNNRSSLLDEQSLVAIITKIIEPLEDLSNKMDAIVSKQQDNEKLNIYDYLGDFFVDSNSQAAVGFKNVDVTTKLFTYKTIQHKTTNGQLRLTDGSINSKTFKWSKSINSIGIPHNLETKDDEIISSILSSISMGSIEDNITKDGFLIYSNCLVDFFPSSSFNGKIKIPSDVKIIKKGAFERCSDITEIILPKWLTEIEEGVFKDDCLQRVYYEGDESQLDRKKINKNFSLGKVYYYSDKKPAYGSHYWHYNSTKQPEVWKSIKVTGVTPNGSLNLETTTQITFTFSEDPGNLAVSDFSFSDGKATYLQGSGNTRTVGINGFNLKNTRRVSVRITPKSEYCFENEREYSDIYVKLTPIVYRDMGRDYFSGNFGDDYVDEHIFGESTVFPKACKVGRRFIAWYLMDEDGNYTTIESLPADFHSESITVYAEWKSNLNMNYFDGTPLEIVYNMRGDKMRAPDVFCGTGDVSQSDLSYMLRESLFPALSRLSIGGYSYELNFDLIKSYELNGDVLTIELFDDYRFSDGSQLEAEDFVTYYNLIHSFYADEDLPAPWSYITSVTGEGLELEIQFDDYTTDVSYFLHEFRAAPTDWLSDNPIIADSAEEVNNFCLESFIPSYGKYGIEDYNNIDEISLTANPYYARADETDAPDINITILNSTDTTIMKWQDGSYDAYFNMIENDVDEYVDNSEEIFHKYENKVRILIGLGKNSMAFTYFDDEDFRIKWISAFYRFIASFRLGDSFKNSMKETSGWATDTLTKMYIDDLTEIESGLTPLSSVEFRIMLEEFTGIPVDTWINFTLFVPRNDICRQIAEIIQEEFHMAYVEFELVYSDNIEDAAICDFCLFPYDFTGYNLFGKDVLSSDYLKYIFFPYNNQNEDCYLFEFNWYAFYHDTIGYGAALRALNAIMINYCYKLNHIPKGYVSSDDFHNLIYGNVRLLVY